MAQDYNKTLNLPATDFAMRAGLPKREPDMLKGWYDNKRYETLMEKNKGKPLFILHDGPPFSNGNIHIGTALNKILKDFIVRYKNMSGFSSPYVPGWDNHGMPIESAIIKKNKLDRKKMSVSEFRTACKAFASDFVNIQREEFKRLGVLGDWDNPYLTMAPSFEAVEVKVFGAMYEKGYIYKGLKPVYWCPDDETALAEAEIEYNDDTCEAIFVKFPVKNDLGKLSGLTELSKTYFVIWTTTTWTLPGNLAISLHPEFEYILMKVLSGEVYIVAKELAASVAKSAGIEGYEILATIKGSEFEKMTAKHPFFDRDSLIITGEHVTLEAGSGCVHTAPGHGMEDFEVCKNYDIVPIVPVDGRGFMTENAGKYAGLRYNRANDAILADLKESGMLLASEKLKHSYPHCWRCKNPIIYRATEQWFASVDAIKDMAVDACDDISWYPKWGQDRMTSMIRERSDWCISRQRHWGLPIPVFYCKSCRKPVCNTESIDAVSRLFGAEGSNSWFEKEAEDILPEGFACPHCGAKSFTKETDTLDGWFDSGSTHAGVLSTRPELKYPADIYLEGGDQYRGWFQSSMLTSIATNGIAPYKTIITHGWTVDGEGKAMHKSLGNTVAPEEVIKDYGADILRLWVASSDYRSDVRISKDIFKQLSDAYLKIRNTARFILGNLNGFDPNDQVPFEKMIELDQWALRRFNRLVKLVREAYETYEYHPIYHGLHNFCVVDMSNIYLDIIKDRLYCEKTGSFPRKSAQSAMYRILDGMVRLIAPILAFTAEEIWQYMPHHDEADAESVLFNEMPAYDESLEFSAENEGYWEKILALRTDVNKALELARAEKLIGKPLDAEVTVYLDDEAKVSYEAIKDHHFTALLIVSKATFIHGEGDGMKAESFKGATIKVQAAQTPKCPRCWIHDEHADPETGLCPRCAGVLAQ